MSASINQQFSIKIIHKESGIELPNYNVNSFEIKESIFSVIPYVELNINDAGYLTEIMPILDNEVLTIHYAPNELTKNDIIFDVIIYEYSIQPIAQNSKSYIILHCYLALPIFYPALIKSYNGTSKDVLSKVTTELGYKFNTNIANSQDFMTWYRHGSVIGFIKDVVNKSYIANDVGFFYFDLLGNGNYKSYRSSISNSPKFPLKYDRVKQQALFTNDKTINYNVYEYANKNGYIKGITGYGSQLYTYNADGKSTKTSYVDTYTSTQLKNVNRLNANNVSNVSIVGWDKSNRNVYAGYGLAKVQNEVIRNNLVENTIAMSVNPDSDVKLMDVYEVSIPSNLTGDTDNINHVLSGLYVVTSISHGSVRNGVYQKNIVLGRRGINKSTDRKVSNVG